MWLLRKAFKETAQARSFGRNQAKRQGGAALIASAINRFALQVKRGVKLPLQHCPSCKHKDESIKTSYSPSRKSKQPLAKTKAPVLFIVRRANPISSDVPANGIQSGNQLVNLLSDMSCVTDGAPAWPVWTLPRRVFSCCRVGTHQISFTSQTGTFNTIACPVGSVMGNSGLSAKNSSTASFSPRAAAKPYSSNNKTPPGTRRE